VRSTTQRKMPRCRSASVPRSGSHASMPRMPRATILLVQVYALSATTDSGRNSGAPALPLIFGMASISGMRNSPSGRFAPEIVHESGTPWASVET